MAAELAWREATDADVDAVVALVRAAYRGDASRAGWTSEAHLVDGRRTDPAEVRAAITTAGSLMLVVERPFAGAAQGAGALLACCHLHDDGDGVIWFGTFAVDPERQGGGTGAALLEAACALAAQRLGAWAVRIKVLEPQTALLGFYERRGFTRTGALEPFGDAGEGDDRALVDGLRFVELERAL